MDTPETLFKAITDKLVQENNAVTAGKMMSSPAITCNGKVFAFYHDSQMIFKLGESFEPQNRGIQHYSHLSPFKSKPPMRAWFQIPYEEHAQWEALARQALQHLIEELS